MDYKKIHDQIQKQYTQLIWDIKHQHEEPCDSDVMCTLFNLNQLIDKFNKAYIGHIPNRNFYGFFKYQLKLITE